MLLFLKDREQALIHFNSSDLIMTSSIGRKFLSLISVLYHDCTLQMNKRKPITQHWQFNWGFQKQQIELENQLLT